MYFYFSLVIIIIIIIIIILIAATAQGLLKSLGTEPSVEGVDFVAHSRRNSIDFDMGDESHSLKAAAALMASSYPPQTAHFSSLQSSE